ncbi:immunoglobulin-like domain-containing protein, partial [Clostridium perfringens]|uniref:immunoglobulin-like domain-containing protein n=1 Tax=Clostridium perfringens TaxID=1502 RepID=UPI0039E8DE98
EKLTNGLRNFRFSGVVRQPIKYKSNDKPVITANNVIIKVNTPINLLTDKAIGLTATDKEDGTITNKVTVKSDGGLDVNDPKVGTYKVVYTVTDRDGNTTEKEITITVVSNDKPVISGADNISITEGTAFDPMAGVT